MGHLTSGVAQLSRSCRPDGGRPATHTRLGCDHISTLYKFTITYLLTYLVCRPVDCRSVGFRPDDWRPSVCVLVRKKLKLPLFA